MTIYTPNIIISKNYSFMNNFMNSRYFSDVNVPEADDAIIFNKKQNRYVYSLEHSFNYGSADFHLTLKIMDVDGTFENQFFNETFFQRQMNTAVKKYIEDTKKPQDRAAKFSDFQLYVSDLLDSQIRIYVAYGIGDDLQTWTDPMACTLVAASIDAAPNGVRNYTYKFIPEVNNFFRPELKKNEQNPNEDVIYDFGAISVETSYKIKSPQARDVRGNIYRLLKGFCAKAANVDEANVIVVLPEFNSSLDSASAVTYIKTDPLNDIDDLRAFRNRPTIVKSIATLDFNNPAEVQEFYSKIFKHIKSEFSKSNLTSKVSSPGLKTNLNKQDVIAELNKDIASNKLRISQINKDIKDLNYGNWDVILPNNNVVKASQEISRLQEENVKLEETIQSKLRQGIPGDDPQLKPYFLKKIDNTNKLKSLKNKLQQTKVNYAKEREQKAKESEDLSDKVNKLTDSSDLNDLDVYASRGYEFTPDEWHLTLRAEGDIANDQNKIPLPNWRAAINDVFKGIATIYNQGESYISPQISFETSLRWLKLFKEVGLINDPTKPCLVVGDRQMVLDYIYCNQIPLTDIEKSKSSFPLDRKDPLWIAHNGYNYKTKVVDLVSRKRNSSSFGEKLYLDELQLDQNNPLIKDTNLTLDDITRKYDIPVFVNNFKNSNIISYSLKNSENYISSIKTAVKSNRLKYLYSELSKDDERVKDLYKAAGITDPNAIEIAKKLYFDTVGTLPQEIKDIKFTQIDKSFNQIKENFYDKSPANRSEEDLTKYTQYQRSGLTAKFVTEQYGDTGLMAPTNMIGRGTSQFYATPLILTQNSQNVSYLNLAIQKVLYNQSTQNKNGTFGKIDLNNLAAIADFIIMLNASNDINGGNTVTFIPGATLPNRNFILAKIHEYNVVNSLNMTIKTLPFFNLTDSRTMNKPSILYSKRVSIVGSDPVDVMDFFTGEYRIVGFRHVITTSECYSEFSLSKYLTADQKVG